MNSLPNYNPTLKIATVCRRLMLVTVIAILVGCAQIPPEAIELNKMVSENIKVLKDNNLLSIDAWEENGHIQIDNNWNLIYDKATKIYSRILEDPERNHDIDPSLRDRDIGKLASTITQKLKAKVSDQAKDMRRIVEENTKTIVAANNSISRLLASANAVATTRTQILGDLEMLPSINIPELNKIISEEIESIN